MTDDTQENPRTLEAVAPAEPQPANHLSGKGKSFWTGVGIGSAAIIAAVMYAKRPKKKRR